MLRVLGVIYRQLCELVSRTPGQSFLPSIVKLTSCLEGELWPYEPYELKTAALFIHSFAVFIFYCSHRFNLTIVASNFALYNFYVFPV